MPAAALAREPGPRMRPVGRCTTSWFFASIRRLYVRARSGGGFEHLRAAVPQRRIGSKKWRVLREPSCPGCQALLVAWRRHDAHALRVGFELFGHDHRHAGAYAVAISAR